MILGIDHVALSCSNMEDDLRSVQRSGLEVIFVHRDLPNSITKKPFLSSYQTVHAAAYCQAVRGISLEITAHGAPVEEAASWYQVLMEGLPENQGPFKGRLPCSSEIWEKTLECQNAQAAVWRPFKAQFWYDASKSAAGPESGSAKRELLIRALLVPVTEIERSLLFWTEGLKFRVMKRGKENGQAWIHLSWRSPIPKWSLEVILSETKETLGVPYLDRPGFPCLAFISNDLVSDRLQLIQCAAQNISEISDHIINGKALKVAFARGPSQELVELIEIAKKPVQKADGEIQ